MLNVYMAENLEGGLMKEKNVLPALPNPNPSKGRDAGARRFRARTLEAYSTPASMSCSENGTPVHPTWSIKLIGGVITDGVERFVRTLDTYWHHQEASRFHRISRFAAFSGGPRLCMLAMVCFGQPFVASQVPSVFGAPAV